jgi:phenylpropionate dioxygenase-like ring-hydroxylating dioxygenase large terminal subunit
MTMVTTAPVQNATLANYWSPIGTSDEVGEQPKRFRLLDEDIVVFRDSQGLVALRDLCIHRGTSLALGSIVDGRLRCAYHGWEYDRTGACVRIPALPEGSPIPRKARAMRHHATEAHGLVWVALADPVAPVPTWPDDEFRNPDYVALMMSRHDWKSSAGRAVENFMDASHFPFVHHGLLGNKELIERHEIVPTNYGFKYGFYQPEPSGITHREYHVYLPWTVHIRRFGPGDKVTIVSLLASPVSAKQTKIFMFLVRNHAKDDASEFTDLNELLMAEDGMIVESQRPEEIPTDLREELHIKVPDAAAIAYRRALGELDVKRLYSDR